MHAIARRIAARFTNRRDHRRRRNDQEDEEDYDDDDYERIEVRITNSHRQSTPRLIPFERPNISVHNSYFNNQANSDTCDEESICKATKKPSLLYNLAKSWAWPALAHRCETHPWEARSDIVNRDGDTALHWAVFGNAPLYVIENLLNACPELINVKNVAKQLPIHVACCYRSPPETLRALIVADPDTLGHRNKFGFYPLHIMCDCGCPKECLEIMLQYPQAVKTIREKDYMYERTPLYILNQRKNLWAFGIQTQSLRTLRQRQRDAVQCGTWTGEDERKLQIEITQARENEFWWKARLLIIAESRREPGLFRDERYTPQEGGTIQACLDMKDCPPSLLEYAILAYSEELLVRDATGKLPLHDVCARGSARKRDQWLVVEVLGANPKAARIRNYQHMLPLEIFVNSSSSAGWSGAVKRLILAHPVAIDNLRVNANLYPLILQEIGSENDTKSEVYELIKASPGLFSSFANHQPYKTMTSN